MIRSPIPRVRGPIPHRKIRWQQTRRAEPVGSSALGQTFRGSEFPVLAAVLASMFCERNRNGSNAGQAFLATRFRTNSTAREGHGRCVPDPGRRLRTRRSGVRISPGAPINQSYALTPIFDCPIFSNTKASLAASCACTSSSWLGNRRDIDSGAAGLTHSGRPAASARMPSRRALWNMSGAWICGAWPRSGNSTRWA